jgi:hypothetical protein
MRQSQVTLPYFGLGLVRGVDGLQVALACYFPCNIGLPPQGFWVGVP